MSDTHRRDFVRGLALGGLTALPVAARGDEPKKPDHEEAKPPPDPPTEVDARMALIVARYGKLIDDEARKAIRAEVEAVTARAERLRRFELTNGDEPFPVFTPYRKPLA